MPQLRLKVFGPLRLEVGGQTVRLAPLDAAVLIRLLVADGAPVSVEDLYRDVWDGTGQIQREQRTFVQKRIKNLRRLLDPDRPGGASALLPLERSQTSMYRLVVSPEQVDLLEFRQKLEQARDVDIRTAMTILAEAASMSREQPLATFEGSRFAKQTIEATLMAREAALRDLMAGYRTLGQLSEAVVTGEMLLRLNPSDTSLAEEVADLRRRSGGWRASVASVEFRRPRFRVTIDEGDLFEQPDAQVVVGFSDTFDTSPQHGIISPNSVQGQLLERVYLGDVNRLNRDLRGALRQVEQVATESRSNKPHGKLSRYPIGTVAVLRNGETTVFGVAYSRMGNDLRAQSTLDTIRNSLDALWHMVDLKGQLEPVAIPLVGAGLARLAFVTYTELIELIVGSFVRRSLSAPISRELRLILRGGQVGTAELDAVAGFLNRLSSLEGDESRQPVR